MVCIKKVEKIKIVKSQSFRIYIRKKRFRGGMHGGTKKANIQYATR
jgi:hypothetical protein